MTSFSHERYNELVEETVTNLKQLGILKGGEYAGDNDRLANFRRNGVALGLPMEAIWSVYTAKHWDAIQQYVHDVIAGKTRPRMESISGRADDMIVYLILFKAMVEEREGKVPYAKIENKDKTGIGMPGAGLPDAPTDMELCDNQLFA